MNVQYQCDRIKIKCAVRDNDSVVSFVIYAYFRSEEIYIYRVPQQLVYFGKLDCTPEGDVVNDLSTEMYDKLELVVRNSGFFQSKKVVQM